MERILPQIEQQVKCIAKGCSEPVFRNGLCFDHFVEIEIQAWDDEDAERQMALEMLA